MLLVLLLWLLLLLLPLLLIMLFLLLPLLLLLRHLPLLLLLLLLPLYSYFFSCLYTPGPHTLTSGPIIPHPQVWDISGPQPVFVGERDVKLGSLHTVHVSASTSAQSPAFAPTLPPTVVPSCLLLLFLSLQACPDAPFVVCMGGDKQSDNFKVISLIMKWFLF